METLKLGPWTVLPPLNRLRHDDGPETLLEPKVMQVLVGLAARPGEVVSREELLAAAWPGEYVTEHVLSRSISELRKALGDDHRAPQYIETIRKGGFRLIAPVSAAASLSESAAPADTPTPSPERSRPTRTRTWPWIGLSVLATVAVALAFVGSVYRVGTEPPAPTGLPRPLTSFQGSELDPALSPDGQRLAFSWSGPEGRNFDVYVKSLDDEEPLRLTHHPGEDKNPAWSPDGERIAFVRSSQGTNGLFVVPLLGGAERKLADCVSGDIPDLVWSGDGRYLFFPDREALSEPSGIFRLDVETREKRRVTRPPERVYGDRDLTASPDGRRVGFARAVIPGVEDLYVASVDDGDLRLLTFDGRSISGLEWLRGDQILFSSDRDGTARLWRISVDPGAEPRLHLELGDGAYDPSLSSETQRLVFERRVYDTNIRRLDLAVDATAEPRLHIASTRMDGSPVISPDGQKIAFTSLRSGAIEMWVSRIDGARALRITDSGARLPGEPSWTPDGEQLIFALLDTDQSDLYRVSVHGGPSTRLTSSSWNEISPILSADGQRIYYGSDQTGDWQIRSVAAEGGESVRVTRRGGIRALEAPGGDFLYFSRPDHGGIWRVRADGGRETLVFAPDRPVHWTAWTLVGDRIYFRTTEPNPVVPSSIFRYDVATSTLELVMEGVPGRGNPGLGLTVSPSEDVLLYGNIDRSDGDIMLVDGFR